jgi:hypothetical protein
MGFEQANNTNLVRENTSGSLAVAIGPCWENLRVRDQKSDCVFF